MALYQYASDPLEVSAVIFEVDFNMTFKQILRTEMLLQADPDCIFIVGLTDVVAPLPRPMMGSILKFHIYFIVDIYYLYCINHIAI